jgi:hypothetical protein
MHRNDLAVGDRIIRIIMPGLVRSGEFSGDSCLAWKSLTCDAFELCHSCVLLIECGINVTKGLTESTL